MQNNIGKALVTMLMCGCMHSALAQKVVRFTPSDTTAAVSLKTYNSHLEKPDTLQGIAIIGKEDTLYSFQSINSRVVAFRRDKQFILQELYAIPIEGKSNYYLVPLREFTVSPSSGKVTKNKLFLASQVKDQKRDSTVVRAEYEDVRKEVDKQARIDEYDEVLVHRTAVLVWDLTLNALSGDEEFYSILTNIEAAVPSVVAGESGYAWKDCRFLLHSEKVDGFE